MHAGLKVLVVDDYHDGAEALGDLLTLLGCDVRLAFSGEEAVDGAPDFLPVLVILDLGLPGMDGFEALRILRMQEWAGDAVFVSHSASRDVHIQDATKQAGFDYHVRKPAAGADFEDVLAALHDRGGAAANVS